MLLDGYLHWHDAYRYIYIYVHIYIVIYIIYKKYKMPMT